MEQQRNNLKMKNNNKNKNISQQAPKGQIVHQQTAVSFSGPLPPPEVLEGYNKILPNAAERILVLAEGEAKHRRGIEDRVVKHNVCLAHLGQVFGFLLGAIGLLGGVYCVAIGQAWGGVGIVSGSLVSLVSVFVWGNKPPSA